MGDDVPVNQGVVPALEIAVAILGVLAFAAWVPVVRGLSQAQTDLARSYGWHPGARSRPDLDIDRGTNRLGSVNVRPTSAIQVHRPPTQYSGSGR
jgi:hypothetical protein